VGLGGGKLAGILLEMTAEADCVNWVVVGVGLNVRRPEGVRPSEKIAFLEDAVPGVRIAKAVAVALEGIARTYADWLRGGFSELRGQYESHLSLIGEAVNVRDIGGAVKASGTVTGIDEEGRLLILGASGEAAVAAGEVTLRDRM
jgi:BirA family biotin operon repressor/biotin-[acetyl-CoA-carboxylase] ligase